QQLLQRVVHALAHLAPEELHEARLGAERLAALKARQRAPVVEPRDLDLDGVLREPLAENTVPAARRLAVGALARQAQEVVEQHAVDDELARRGAALVGERRGGDRPALVLAADEMVVREEEPLLSPRVVGGGRLPDRGAADPVVALGWAGGGQPLHQDVGHDDRAAAPAVLARPVDADPAAVVEPALPGAEEGDLVGEGRVLRRGRPIRAEPRAQLGAEGLLGGAEREIHYTTPRARRPASSPAPTPTSASTAAVSAPSAAAGR